MKSILLFLNFCATLAAVSGYEIKINGSGLSYQGKEQGGQVCYWVNGKVAGYARKLGGKLVYTDAKNNNLGYMEKIGGVYIFKDSRGSRLGEVRVIGGKHHYHTFNGSIIGQAAVLGGKTIYKSSSGAFLGEANSKAMPLRPIPLENKIGKIETKQHNREQIGSQKCHVIVLTKITPGSPAEKAGLKAMDFLISYKGSKENSLSMGKKGSKAVEEFAKNKLITPANKMDKVQFIVGRQFNNNGRASFKIIVVNQMPLGTKGFFWAVGGVHPAVFDMLNKAYANWGK